MIQTETYRGIVCGISRWSIEWNRLWICRWCPECAAIALDWGHENFQDWGSSWNTGRGSRDHPKWRGRSVWAVDGDSPPVLNDDSRETAHGQSRRTDLLVGVGLYATAVDAVAHVRNGDDDADEMVRVRIPRHYVVDLPRTVSRTRGMSLAREFSAKRRQNQRALSTCRGTFSAQQTRTRQMHVLGGTVSLDRFVGRSKERGLFFLIVYPLVLVLVIDFFNCLQYCSDGSCCCCCCSVSFLVRRRKT